MKKKTKWRGDPRFREYTATGIIYHALVWHLTQTLPQNEDVPLIKELIHLYEKRFNKLMKKAYKQGHDDWMMPGWAERNGWGAPEPITDDEVKRMEETSDWLHSPFTLEPLKRDGMN